jgi:hypothetical protein
MKTLKFAAFLFYRYYSGGIQPDSTPHFKTILSLTFIGFIHLFQLLIILDKVNLIPISEADGKMYKRWIMFCIMFPIAIVVALLFPKKELVTLQSFYQDKPELVRKGNNFLIAYIVVNFSLIILLTIILK